MTKRLTASIKDGVVAYQAKQNGYKHKGRIGRIMALRELGSEAAINYQLTAQEASDYLEHVTVDLLRDAESLLND